MFCILVFVFMLLFVVFCVLFIQVDSFIMCLLNKLVFGGVVVVDFGEEGLLLWVFYQGKLVLVVCEEGCCWIVVVGILLSIKFGLQKLEV